MKAVLTDERFSDPNWIFERKLDGIRCIAIRSGKDLSLLSRNDLSAERTLSRAGRGARSRDDASSSRSTGRWSRSRGRRRASRASPSAHQHYVPVFLYVFDVLWLDGHDVRPLPLRSSQAAAQERARVPRHRALDAVPQRRRRGAVQRGLPQGLGGADRQARRQPVRHHALEGLAQVQVRARPGARDRRLHRTAGLARRVRRAAARLLPRRPARVRRQGRHRVRHRDAPRRSARSCAQLQARRPAVRRPEHDQGTQRHLGRAAARGPDRLHRVDPRRAPAPPPVPRPAETTRRPPRWSARDERTSSRSAAARSGSRTPTAPCSPRPN